MPANLGCSFRRSPRIFTNPNIELENRYQVLHALV